MKGQRNDFGFKELLNEEDFHARMQWLWGAADFIQTMAASDWQSLPPQESPKCNSTYVHRSLSLQAVPDRTSTFKLARGARLLRCYTIVQGFCRALSSCRNYPFSASHGRLGEMETVLQSDGKDGNVKMRA